jgi:TolA-binding protein
MPSKTLETKDTQKARFTAESETRVAALKEKGVPEKAIARDPQIKHLKARIKQVNGAIARISFLDEQNKKLEEKKQQRIAEAAAERAAEIAGERKTKKKAVEEAAPQKKKGGGKAPSKTGKPEAKKKGK